MTPTYFLISINVENNKLGGVYVGIAAIILGDIYSSF